MAWIVVCHLGVIAIHGPWISCFAVDQCLTGVELSASLGYTDAHAQWFQSEASRLYFKSFCNSKVRHFKADLMEMVQKMKAEADENDPQEALPKSSKNTSKTGSKNKNKSRQSGDRKRRKTKKNDDEEGEGEDAGEDGGAEGEDLEEALEELVSE